MIRNQTRIVIIATLLLMGGVAFGFYTFGRNVFGLGGEALQARADAQARWASQSTPHRQLDNDLPAHVSHDLAGASAPEHTHASKQVDAPSMPVTPGAGRSSSASDPRINQQAPIEGPDAQQTSSSSPATAGDDQRPKDQSDYHPTMIPQPLEPIPGTGVRVTEHIDLGFPFDPAQYAGGTMRLHNDSKGPVAVSFHGDDVGHVRLNGQPVEPGRKYLLEGEAEVRADRHVGVHLRSLDGSERQPAPDGPG